MAVETYVERARDRVRAEREAVGAKHDALERFVRRVEEVLAEPRSAPAGVAAVAGPRRRADRTGDGGCRAVRTAFSELVRPHSVDDTDGDEPLLETIRAELGDPVAAALAPATGASLTPELRRTVVAEAEARRAEATALGRALDREARQLDDAGSVVEEVIDWVVEADARPLTALGFDALRRRHGTLAEHRRRCDELARLRQEFLDATTSNGAETTVRHRWLVPYLYADFPVDHPVLATAAKLDGVADECQRAVRDHLCRRA